MAGTFTLEGSDGQLLVAKGTLYTVTAGQATLMGLTLVNTSSADVTVNIYLNRTGTSRRIVPKDWLVPAGALASWPGDGGQLRHILQNGDTVEGDAVSASVVDYVISVVRET